MKDSKSRPETRLDRLIRTWQGWQSIFQTFEDDEINIEEVRQLLDEGSGYEESNS